MKLTQTNVIGDAVADRELAWPGHIKFLDWLDEEHLIYCTISGKLTCLHLETQKPVWQHDIELKYGSFSLCRSRRVFAVLFRTESGKSLFVIDCDTGNFLLDIDKNGLAKILGIDFALPTNIALTPVHAKLVVTCFGLAFGANGYIIDNQYKAVERQFDADGHVSRLSVSPDESRITMLADKYTVSVYDLKSEEWIFLQGERVYERQDYVEGDSSPGVNHVFHDGKDILIFNNDGGMCGTGYLHSIKDNKTTFFPAYNAHNELDVDFNNRRTAITGTGLDVLLVSFEGKELAYYPDANLQRNSCIKFSPSFGQLAVGSWDNTVSIYDVSEQYDPEAPTYSDNCVVDFGDIPIESDKKETD